MDAMVLSYVDGMDMGTWAISFRRCAANAGCTEELATDNDASRPVTNAIVEKKCAGCKALRSVLEQYARRPDEKVCLLVKVIAAVTTKHAKVRAGHDFLSLTPTYGSTLADWCQEVKAACIYADMTSNWPVCLAKFESGCSASQLAIVNLKHLKCDNWTTLFELCLVLSSTESGDAGSAVVQTQCSSPSTFTTSVATAVNRRGGKEQARTCFNCKEEGHVSQECTRAFSKTSYDYWTRREKNGGVNTAIRKKLKDYRRKEGIGNPDGRKKASMVAVTSHRSGQNVNQGIANNDLDDEDEYAQFIKFMSFSKMNKQDSTYSTCLASSTRGESLARRAGSINGRSSWSIIFDSGAGRSIVARKFSEGTLMRKVDPISVRYGSGKVESLDTVAKVIVITEGRRMVWWPYVSPLLPFDILLGEDFMDGRVMLDYVNRRITFAGPNIGAAAMDELPKIPPFPWGDGKPRAELLHRGSTKEEQEAVLEEELKVLKNISEPRIREIVRKYIHLFHEANKSGWVPCNWTPYTLEFEDPNDEWSTVYDYAYDKARGEFIRDKLAMWKARGFCEESDSTFGLPVVCAPKPQPADEAMRIAINFQQTNRFTVKSSYKVPCLDDVFARIKGDTFTVIDGEEGYHKVRMSDESKKYNSLKAVGLVMSCNGMMEGMMNAGNHYQEQSDKMFRRETEKGIALDNWANGYVDDSIIYSQGVSEHLGHLEDVLGRMLRDNVKPKWRKGQFGVSRARFGGRVVTKHGIELRKEKADILRDLRRPRGWKDVQRVFGMFLWHKKFIDHFDRKAKPISRFLAGEWKHRVIKWDDEAEEAYLGLCSDIDGAVARSRAGPGVIHIFTDWSCEAVAYHWYREHKGKQFPMGFGGRTMRGPEMKWKAPRGELYAMAYACRDLKKMCIGKEVVLHTDHIAWSDLNINTRSEVLVGYLMDILELSPKGVFVKGVLNTVADTITRMMKNIDISVAVHDGNNRTVVPPKMRAEVLRETHEGAIGGHFGKSSTMQIVGKKYVPWKGLAREINEYQCRHCDLYKPVRGRFANQAGTIQAYKISRPWELIGIDIEQSTTANGNVFLWIYIVDFFSKFAEGLLLNDKTAGEIIRVLRTSTAWRASVPATMTGDDDTAFIRSSIFGKFLEEEGIEWRAKDAHHHEGVIERGVQTFKHVLEAKTVEGHTPRNALHLASGAVNRGHVASSTGFTPHSLVFGTEYVTALQRKIEMANRNLSKAADKMAKYFDKDKVNSIFEVGEKVLVRDPRKHIPRGEPKFAGPFRIIKAKGHSCTLVNKHTGRLYKRNVKDLRRTVFGHAGHSDPKGLRPQGLLETQYQDRTEGGVMVDPGTPGGPYTTPMKTPSTPSFRRTPISPMRPLSTTKGDTFADETTQDQLTAPEKLIGRRVAVKWPDGDWYSGRVIQKRNNQFGSHEVKYDPDKFGVNREPIYENLTGNSRARTHKVDWKFIDEDNSLKQTTEDATL